MPHQCTECGHVFPDGSKEMLSGCPDCGGNKFQFRPASDARDTDDGSGTSAEPGTSPEGSSEDESPTPSQPSASSDSESTSADPEPSSVDPDSSSADSNSSPAEPTPNDDAGSPVETEGGDRSPPERVGQSDTGSGPANPSDPADPSDPAEPTGADDTDDVDALRRELDDQFESIKILEPGQYELNLMELYNREERIIALKEDGQYVIDVPDTWVGDGDDDS